MVWKPSSVKCPECGADMEYRVCEPEEGAVWLYRCRKCGWKGFDWELERRNKP